MNRRTARWVVGWAAFGYLAVRLYEVSQRRYPLGDVRNPAIVQVPKDQLEGIVVAINNGRRPKKC